MRVAVLAVALLGSWAPWADAQCAPSLTITGDDRVEVSELELEGVRGVDETRLRTALQTRPRSWWPWAEKRYFDCATFESDLKRIEEFYRGRGYPNARVVQSDVQRRDGEVAVRIVVEEGNAIRVGSMEFTGFEAIAPSRVRAMRERAPLKPGNPLDAEVLQQTARIAADALGEGGYAYARITIRQTSLEPERVAVELHAEPGQVGFFGPIEIVGNSSVEDDVIRRQLAYLPGQRFSVSALRESEQRLSRLGLFQSVTIVVVDPRPPLPEVPTRITVKEGDLNQFSYSFGYDSEKQVYGDAQWRHLNFLGGGRSTTIRGRWSSIDRGGEGLFYQPYLFTPRLSLQLSAGAWHVDEPVYTVSSIGGTASVSYLLGRLNRVSATYLQQSERNRVNEDVVADETSTGLPAGLDPFELEQDGVLAALRFDAVRDTTVDAESPRTGYRTLLRVEKAGGWLPGVFAYRNVFTADSYYHSAGPVTLAGRVQFGTIDAAVESAIPFSRRYFLGGAETLRGWGRFEVSPLSSAGVPVGGRTLLVANAEMRFPLTRALSGVVFLDAGNVWADTWKLDLGDLRSNVGIGARVATPFGLVRIDAGYQLTPIQGLRVNGEPQDRRWRIHVSLGQVF
jgi:outer membrane protein assembly complex protein YaeT